MMRAVKRTTEAKNELQTGVVNKRDYFLTHLLTFVPISTLRNAQQEAAESPSLEVTDFDRDLTVTKVNRYKPPE